MIEWWMRHFEPGPVFGTFCLVLLAGLPLMWIVAARRRRATMRFSSTAILSRLRPGAAARWRVIVPVLRTLGVLCLLLALGRPQSDGAVRDLREGIAIQMVLDTSGSMSESDFQLDGQWVRRLDAVKRVFRDFVVGAGGLPGRPSDLIGMTTFAMYADTRCPLTLDHANLVNLLAETEIPGWVGRDERYRHPEAEYTSLGDAIAVATDLLRRAGEQAAAGVAAAAPARSKVMILLTDGANNPPPEARDSSPDPVDAAELAGRLGIRVYTIGAIGSRPRGGSFAMPRAQADEPALRRIAEVTGGRYFRATDTASLVTIYEEIDQLERRTTGERTYRDNTRAARTAMLLGLGCLSAELLLVSTRFRRVP